ncbi:MAG TPA: DUF2817 domain-containing protein [Spirochaetota bacterium]|nr:DUF2817 domain-containing protein [Spirochaetota bacterium]
MKFLIYFLLFLVQPIFCDTYSKVIIGHSIEKRPIYLHQFGGGKELLLIVAGIHGNEENTEETANLLIDKITNGDIQIPEDKSLWVIPAVNPDGLYRGRRFNKNNVDLNRNFLTDKWESTFFFYNTKFSSGKNPFSEPETIALRELFNKIKDEFKIVVISLHSAGDAVIPGNNLFYNNNLIQIIMNCSEYIYDTVGYETFGDLTGWLSDKLGIASVTIEFKSKKISDLDNVEKIVRQLLKVDFLTNIYKNKLDFSFIFKNSEDQKLNWLLEGLPKNIVDNIKSKEANKKSFLQNIKLLESQEDLLSWVNKINKLSNDYIPEDLETLDSSFLSSKKDWQLRKKVLSDLKTMCDDARSNGATLKIISAYRSYETQKRVFEGWVSKFGEKEARRISAEPGYSQHQLGTAIDFNQLDESFDKTKEGIWLLENAYKYGFILSFPKGQEEFTGFKYEPWHYRYIGKDASFLVYNFFDNSLELFLSWYWSKKEKK